MKRLLAIIFLPLALLTSCRSRNEEPNPGINKESQETKIREMKYDIKIDSSDPIDVSFIATKGLDPNIYRDGKIISQGNFIAGDKERVSRNLHTVFSHTGSAFVLNVLFFRTKSRPQPEEISVNLLVKMYKAETLVDTYRRVIRLTNDNRSTSEEFQLWGG